MRNASTYRGARRNAIRPIWEWTGFKERVLVKPRERWWEMRLLKPTPIKRRTTVYTGKMYPAGWRTKTERQGRRALYGLS